MAHKWHTEIPPHGAADTGLASGEDEVASGWQPEDLTIVLALVLVVLGAQSERRRNTALIDALVLRRVKAPTLERLDQLIDERVGGRTSRGSAAGGQSPPRR
jgi:hypothetical protein